MQTPNNNQGQRPPFPGSQPQPQFRPQNGQPQQINQNSAQASASPFANPPTSSNQIKSPAGVTPGSENGNMNFKRPPIPVNGIRPQIPLASPIVRPPVPQSPSTNGFRPPASQPIPSPFAKSTSPQNSASQMMRPPMSQGPPQMRPMQPEAPSMMRPPMPQASQGNAMLRPPMPQPPQASGGPFARPPVASQPQTLQSTSGPFARPPVAPLSQPTQAAPAMGGPFARPPVAPQPQTPQSTTGPFARPPMASQSQTPRPPLPMRPPVPGSQPMARPPMPAPHTSSDFARPPMPAAQNASNFPRPPMPMPASQNSMRPPMAPMNQVPSRPPFPGSNHPMNSIPPQTNPSMPSAPGPAYPSNPQAPGIRSPSMRYPAGPGYSQQQPSMQQPSYPQSTQHNYHQAQNPTQFNNQGYGGAGQMAAPQPAAPKVNPAAIPSVVAVLEADELRFKESGQPFFTYSSIVENPPPLPSTRSVSIIDDGNSSPQFIRSTLSHIPISDEICENSKIPLSLLIQPFAISPQSEIPLVDFGLSGPLRCNRCRAYINPHVQFIRGGRSYVCNLCDMSNEVPDEYYANLDMSGKRIDMDIRPELKHGTVDFVASKEYFNRPAGKPHLLFVLDSSRAAVGSGAFQTSLESIKAFASNPNAVKYYGGMAILTHDRTLTFYTLHEGRNEPQVLVMGDVFDPFVPLHANDLYFDPTKCSSGLSVLLNHLSTSMTLDSRPVDSSFGAAVSVALESLKVRGGRAIFFQTTLPSYGPGALVNRESSVSGSSAPAADKANPLLFPQGDFYSKLAVQAAEQGISFCLVSTPAAHIDLATLGVLANTSSGTVLHYSRFSAQQQMSRVVGDVVGLLSSSFAFDCLARIRCNSGLQVKKHYGHFYAASNGHDLSFGSISNEQSFAALLEYDGKLSEKERSCFQVAFLHTDAFSGQRRIRVLNLALPCTSSIQTIFRMAELDSILSFYLKKNVSQILEAPAPAFPATFTAKCVNILAAYRKYCAANMSSGQLILPDSLKLFPVMTLAIHKDPAFNTAPISIDARWHAIHRLSDLSIPLTITHFYPQLFPLMNVLEYEEILPACLRLSREHLTRDGIYLLNDGKTLTLYIGDSVDSNILKEIFGVTQLNAVNLSSSNSNLPIIQNARSAKIRQILTVIKSQNAPRHLNLRLIRQSVDIAEDAEFAAHLVEDASSLASSYVDFLCRVHSQIQHSISQGNSLSLAERTSILSFLQ